MPTPDTLGTGSEGVELTQSSVINDILTTKYLLF